MESDKQEIGVSEAITLCPGMMCYFIVYLPGGKAERLRVIWDGEKLLLSTNGLCHASAKWSIAPGFVASDLSPGAGLTIMGELTEEDFRKYRDIMLDSHAFDEVWKDPSGRRKVFESLLATSELFLRRKLEEEAQDRGWERDLSD